MIISHEGRSPSIGKNVFIAPTAVVIGDVTLADGASIWYGAVIRGDSAAIHIGRDTNIQDNCTLHVDAEVPVVIGESVVVGHNAVIHGCTIENLCLIGIGAVILNHARIRTGSVVAAGALVRENQVIGPRELAAGIPAQIRKQLPASMPEDIRHDAETYLGLAREHARATSGRQGISDATPVFEA